MSNPGEEYHDHPYLGFHVPKNVPFELRQSPGKGWGGFATKHIKEGSPILKEKPLFVIRMPHELIEEKHVFLEFLKLPPSQKAEFLCLRENASEYYSCLHHAFAENGFWVALPDSNRPPANGPFLLSSRFNHSCIPNAGIFCQPDGSNLIRATQDIQVGEEITFSYQPDFKGKTKSERYEVMKFTCNCRACLPDTPFQKLSDIRRRLLRGLQYLTRGVDLDGQRQSSHSPIIIDPKLKKAAEDFSIPISSRLFYTLLTIFLLEEEGLLNHSALSTFLPLSIKIAKMFKSESNRTLVIVCMNQKSWLQRLILGFDLYGRQDDADNEVVEWQKLGHFF